MDKETQSAPPSAERMAGLRNLLCGFAALILFAFGVVPLVNRTARGFGIFRGQEGTDATGLFYTETEEVAEADNYLRNARQFPCRAQPLPLRTRTQESQEHDFGLSSDVKSK
jgi:hypothetical protein